MTSTVMGATPGRCAARTRRTRPGTTGAGHEGRCHPARPHHLPDLGRLLATEAATGHEFRHMNEIPKYVASQTPAAGRLEQHHRPAGDLAPRSPPQGAGGGELLLYGSADLLARRHEPRPDRRVPAAPLSRRAWQRQAPVPRSHRPAHLAWSPAASSRPASSCSSTSRRRWRRPGPIRRGIQLDR